MRRRTFWLTCLAMFFVNLIFALILFSIGVIGQENGIGLMFFLAVLFWLYNVLLSLSLQARRLHDIGKSGAWVLLSLVPFGGIVLLIFYLSDSVIGSNQYGPNPKGIN